MSDAEARPQAAATGGGDTLGFPELHPRPRPAPLTQETSFLLHWTYDGDPAKANCGTAFNIMLHCLLPSTQLRHLYRSGTVESCERAMREWRTCLRARSALQSGNKERAAELMKDVVLPHQHDSLDKHVWAQRAEPPPLFRRPEEQQPAAAAAAATGDK